MGGLGVLQIQFECGRDLAITWLFKFAVFSGGCVLLNWMHISSKMLKAPTINHSFMATSTC
ncbi:hypothetical protein Slit_0920 [Sideroxydans lithotrophicus ES-1]|uniref:Uncharacterized protein n=1 Tax=Sideroxydans lithotrophicus (strain ES-1) TaxID=580332 RepID=D5CPZ4_SIDLE|nr:hypothetical protein Slit_0920 [Sideroxydans lithotrophicus ES-1]